VSATEQLLAERYGRGAGAARRRRIEITVLAAVLLVTFLGWAIVVNFFSGGGVSVATDSFSVVDANHSSVKFTVTGTSGKAARCEITAANGEFQVVGYRSFNVPAGESGAQSFETTLNTTELPFSVSVQNCQFR
jgi:hypothetical protein